ncbi:hypothetical protein ASPZODRAFT_24518 [Penicilliopsis zonata CBS 506.65]|uniref:Glycogen debranching enzyme n=1 Tax=Penicilliopsis zonata CBS 506.65 TaxID=1073090 RepID=A0A1L9SKA9_9EURO|nr:hypothetical protein ASPZODRAFT_24518 [Penicilliopsis zonata CBS 506.65]OJJ47605.1 hypothetical protein ASPZODRAFT_24518 [Penicilliopsis zonata CBS 506.65]
MKQVLLFSLLVGFKTVNGDTSSCSAPPATLALSDPPYNNYFYSDCNVAAQVVVTSPLADSDLTVIGPRLIVAWPAGNSGACAFFAPQSGVNGTLAIELVNSTVGTPLAAVNSSQAGVETTTTPAVGVSGVLRFNASAVLTLPILGSVRTIRDFVEGASILRPEIQDAITVSTLADGSVALQRLWLDNVTTSTLSFAPWNENNRSSSSSSASGSVTLNNQTVQFEQGDYLFSATIDYPQLTQLTPAQDLNDNSSDLIVQYPDQTTALSFLSYSEKLLAGAWRFLTYFGRDSMISALLLEPVLSYGNGSAIEAVIGAVLERIDRTDGSVCHEETIGDYATWTNLQNNIISTAMSCSYGMIDTDYYLPVLMQKYFVDNHVGKTRFSVFSKISAGSIDSANLNLTYGQLALINGEKIMRLAAPFASNQTKENLVHLKDGQIVGQWRDSTYGIGGGRIPFDVNTALMPAALRSIAVLARNGIYANHSNWGELADNYAQVWEDSTLQFFEVTVPQAEARQRVVSYSASSNFTGPNQTTTIDEDVRFYALSLDGYDDLAQVQVMHTDDCFRHLLLNTTNQTQLSTLLNATANNLRRTFPAGLLTDVGMLIANPAYGPDPVYAQNWTTGAYHGTVVWSWQMAMMAKGLELQLSRCNDSNANVPDFCQDPFIYNNVRSAYNTLWDSIEANTAELSTEMWSWVYDGGFQVEQLAELPPPPGVSGQTESDIRQLWSLTFLAVSRLAV